MVAHVQTVAVAQRQIGQVCRVDLDDGDIVILIAADILRVIGITVVKGDLHGVRIAHHMVVGDNVTIRGQDKAGTGAGSLCCLSEKVGFRSGGDVDSHHAVDVGCIQLRIGHGGLAVHGLDLNLRGLAVGDIHFCSVAAGVIPHQIGGAAAYQTAQQGAHQRQRRDLQAHAVLTVFVGGLSALGLHLRLLRSLLLLLAVVVELLVHTGLLGVIALTWLGAVLAISIVVQILFIVIHKSNLLERREPMGLRRELPP